MARMADRLPSTVLCYTDAHTPLEFRAPYVIRSHQFVATHRSCDESTQDADVACNFFVNAYVLIFLLADGCYVFEVAAGPSSSLVTEKKLKLSVYRTGQTFRVPGS